MKVFLSWSGEVSHSIALKLYEWLPMVIQRVQPYISSEIEKGTRWNTDIAKELESSVFGIACVTAENKDAPWLLFEAGALSKSVTDGRLAPLLCGIEQTDIQRSPISQFQMTKFEKDEFSKLLHSINDALGEDSLDRRVLDGLFGALWPEISRSIDSILSNAKNRYQNSAKPIDGEKIMGAIEELITNSRATSQLLSRPEKLLPEDYVFSVIENRRNYQDGQSIRELRQVSQSIDKATSFLDDIKGADDDDAALLGQVRYLLRDTYGMLRHMGMRRTSSNQSGTIFGSLDTSDREARSDLGPP